MNKNIYLLIASLFCSCLSVAQNRYYVDDSASGMNDGSSWSHAYPNLHAALTAAQPGDEIWVAQGVYYPASDANRDTFFNLPSGVRLIGGFFGN
ncbi:MAG: hypothetical protein IT261_10230 [Saprospiraceae bacterium]|nr:hypothetical protein [Saprospiraceae bacterium]